MVNNNFDIGIGKYNIEEKYGYCVIDIIILLISWTFDDSSKRGNLGPKIM